MKAEGKISVINNPKKEKIIRGSDKPSIINKKMQ
jgi:hypothetical protein